jgi:RNA polymerase sigma-70 factor (ECF subfamily)
MIGEQRLDPISPKDWRALVACGVELRRFALSLTRDGPDADDLVQATYARAVARFDQWRRQGELRSWLFSIMQSVQHNEWRQQKQHASAMATMAPLSLATVDGERATADKLTLEAVCKAIDRLPANQRDALLAVVRDGLCYRDAASQLGIPVGTLTSRITRARQAVADATRPSTMPVLKKASSDE